MPQRALVHHLHMKRSEASFNSLVSESDGPDEKVPS